MISDSAASPETENCAGPVMKTASRSPALYTPDLSCTWIAPFHTKMTCSPSAETSVWKACDFFSLQCPPAARFEPIVGSVKKPSLLRQAIFFTAPGVMMPLGGAAPGLEESRAPV